MPKRDDNNSAKKSTKRRSNKATNLENRLKTAWAKYYTVRRDLSEQYGKFFGLLLDMRNLREQLPSNVQALVDQSFRDVVNIHCPNCDKTIELGSQGISKCTHFYHKECLDELKKATKQCKMPGCREYL